MLKKKSKPNTQKSENDLGFGTRIYGGYNRFLNKNGSVNVKRKGRSLYDSIDLFHEMITISWTKFLFLVITGYVIINLLFALVYYFIGQENFGNLKHVSEVKDFSELFFFSAQTITTVGYGYIYPNSVSASTVAAIESMLGLLGFALATGVLYGRFSRPKAGIVYSENIIVAPYKNSSGLMFRIANSKQNELIEIEAQLIVSMKNLQTNTRVFLPLTLERVKINFLALNWTIVHPIDDDSPIYGFKEKDFEMAEAEFIILIKAINDTYSQSVYSRNSYRYDELIYGVKFRPMISEGNAKGVAIININQLSNYDLADLPVNIEAFSSEEGNSLVEEGVNPNT